MCAAMMVVIPPPPVLTEFTSIWNVAHAKNEPSLVCPAPVLGWQSNGRHAERSVLQAAQEFGVAVLINMPMEKGRLHAAIGHVEELPGFSRALTLPWYPDKQQQYQGLIRSAAIRRPTAHVFFLE